MLTPDAAVVLAWLGPLFLTLGLWRGWRMRRLAAPATTWLLVGAIFSFVACWLWR